MTKEADIIRVMLVDDHEMVRFGLGAYINMDERFELVGEAADGVEAVRMCDELQPDVILMDMLMPRMNGIDATRLITRQNPKTRVIAITSFEEEGMVPKALEAGAISYLHKNISMEEIGDAIKKAHVGQNTLSAEATQELVHAATRPSKPGYDLTPRETEVLALMTTGLTNPAIADQLSISRTTVATHVSNILSKLDASNRTEAVKIGIEHGLTK